MDQLKAVAISLPVAGKREAWIKRDDKQWYFDRPDGLPVNPQRWGGGILLLLSGARADRRIAIGASADKLREYGLDSPTLRIDLTVEDGTVLRIEVGMPTPDGRAYYVRRADSSDVYALDQSWRSVIERLVVDPPYP